MPIQFDNYNAEKIERLKMHLSHYAEKGQARPYEIYVDNLKAVPKTEAIEDFYSYESYLNADTEKIKIIIYSSVNSPRNEQFVFLFKANNREQARELGLSGLGQERFTRRSVSLWQQQHLTQQRQHQDTEALRQEISRLKAREKEHLELIATYEQIIAKAKANGNKIGGIHAGDLLSVAVEGLIRRNTHLIAKLPYGAELAGIIAADNQRQQTQQNTPGEHTETPSEFKRLSTPDGQTAQSAFVELFTALENVLSREELEQVSQVLGMVLDQPAMLEDLLRYARDIQGTSPKQQRRDTGEFPGSDALPDEDQEEDNDEDADDRF